jgi:SAM-dependent methyltransferase
VATTADLYGSSYAHQADELYRQIRLETYGADLGQTSWVTAASWDDLIGELALRPPARVLDVACGSGGPALHLARTTGCEVVGVDLHAHAIAAAERQAGEQGLTGRASFQLADATEALPFPDAAFDAVACVDAVNHLAGRAHVFREWQRVVRPGGRVLCTDPVVVTGVVTFEELATRASIGYFVFTPAGENERLLEAAGLRVLEVRDMTADIAELARRWHDARATRTEALVEIEGEPQFQAQQRFLDTASTLARERRLSRLLYVSERPA